MQEHCFNSDFRTGKATTAHADESIWSRVSRETNVVCDGLSMGITTTLKDVVRNPGESVVNAGIAGTISPAVFYGAQLIKHAVPIALLADVVGVGTSLLYRSDAIHRLENVGSALSKSWVDPGADSYTKFVVARDAAPLFVDTATDLIGAAIGVHFGGQIPQRMKVYGQYRFDCAVQRAKERTAAGIIPPRRF